MKTADEMAAEYSYSVTECKQTVTRLRRLTTGLENEAKIGSHYLSPSDAKILRDAAQLLSVLTSRYAVLGKRRKASDDERARVEGVIGRSLSSSFDLLTTIEDKVALIGATASYQLRDNMVSNLRDLDYFFKDAKAFVISRVRNKVLNEKVSVEVAVNGMWTMFCAHRQEIVEKWSSVIARLKEQE